MTDKGETMNHHCDANVKGPYKPKVNQMSSFQWRITSVVPHTLHCNLSLSLFWWDRGIYWQVTWLVSSNLVLLQYENSRKKPFINRAALYTTSYQYLKSWSYPSITSMSEILNFSINWGIYSFLLICIQRTYLSLIKVQRKYYMHELEVEQLR